MRDPQGEIRFESDRVLRVLAASLPADHFLPSELSARLVDEGRLVAFEWTSTSSVASPRLPFVTQPHEWCDEQLFAAAELTLALQDEAVANGFDLKDASAWNVIYAGTQPMFCDLLSFESLRERKWWAAGQFARHFVVPLAVSKRRGLRAHQLFAAWRDGIPSDVARRLLGPGRFLTRHWPLVADGSADVAPPARSQEIEEPATVVTFRKSLHASLSWMLAGARPARVNAATGTWGGYMDERAHYTETALDLKRRWITEWLKQTKPEWVADVGCNTGEFTRIAAGQGADVVALDADHESVQRLFRDTRSSSRIYPVVATLDDLPAGRGWEGAEFPGLAQRLHQRFNVVMLLAVIHHLAVGAAVPLGAIASLAARMTRRWLIVEWLDVEDPQLRLLCAQRRRDPLEFALSRQRDAFLSGGFVIESEVLLAPTARVLALLRRGP